MKHCRFIVVILTQRLGVGKITCIITIYKIYSVFMVLIIVIKLDVKGAHEGRNKTTILSIKRS